MLPPYFSVELVIEYENSRDEKSVHMGGLVGIALATIVAGGLSLLIVAGAQGSGQLGNTLLQPEVESIIVLSRIEALS